jgi:ankyrin repeat protein
VPALIALQAAADAGSSSSSIHELAGQGDLTALQACLDSGTAVDSRDSDGCTALHFAADRGQPEAVMLLLAAGADINAQVNIVQYVFVLYPQRALHFTPDRRLPEAAVLLLAARKVKSCSRSILDVIALVEGVEVCAVPLCHVYTGMAKVAFNRLCGEC